jgi:hypothetical protein
LEWPLRAINLSLNTFTSVSLPGLNFSKLSILVALPKREVQETTLPMEYAGRNVYLLN